MKAQLLNHNVKDGISAKSGKPYKLTRCSFVFKESNGDMNAGTVTLFGDAWPILVNGSHYDLEVGARKDKNGDMTFQVITISKAV